MSELKDFLKDPESYLSRHIKRERQRQEDLARYMDRQRDILEQVYEERREEYAREHEDTLDRARQWAKDHGLNWEALRERAERRIG